MSINDRLAKLEAASGINEPCEWCDYWEVQEEIVKESLRAQGVTPYHPKPQDTKLGRCIECGRPKVFDRSFLNAAERAEADRLVSESAAAEAEGREMSRAAWAEWIRLCDRQAAGMRDYHGPAWDVAIADTGFVHIREFMVAQMEKAPL